MRTIECRDGSRPSDGQVVECQLALKSCSQCGQQKPLDKGKWSSKNPEVCFTCHAKGVGWKFTYGREAFHNTTIGETYRDITESAAKDGVSIQSKHRWV